jgi:hypothetical protein
MTIFSQFRLNLFGFLVAFQLKKSIFRRFQGSSNKTVLHDFTQSFEIFIIRVDKNQNLGPKN